jgi:hypothetical protein
MNNLTNTQELLVVCAQRITDVDYPRPITWAALVQIVSTPRWGDGTGTTWESWIPESMTECWDDLPLEVRIAAYIPADAARAFAVARAS